MEFIELKSTIVTPMVVIQIGSITRKPVSISDFFDVLVLHAKALCPIELQAGYEI